MTVIEMIKKILAMLLIPIQVALLILMLPLLLVFGSGLLSVLVPTRHRPQPSQPAEEDDEEVQED